jgi:hypothetical protein
MICGILLLYPVFRLLIGAAASGSPLAWLWVTLMQLPSTMIVGPGFAAMTEAFPAARRATSVALSFSVGGIIGGFGPGASLLLADVLSSPFAGIYWPIAVLSVGALIYWRWIPDRSGRRMWDDVL